MDSNVKSFMEKFEQKSLSDKINYYEEFTQSQLGYVGLAGAKEKMLISILRNLERDQTNWKENV